MNSCKVEFTDISTHTSNIGVTNLIITPTSGPKNPPIMCHDFDEFRRTVVTTHKYRLLIGCKWVRIENINTWDSQKLSIDEFHEWLYDVLTPDEIIICERVLFKQL